MLSKFICLIGAAVAITAPIAAHAVTITNQDQSKHTLVILEEDDEWSATIQPGKTVANLCNSRCSIAISPGHDLDLAGNESLIIVNGRLRVTRYSD